MNLAEIRKKAVGARKPDDHDVSHAVEPICDDTDGSDVQVPLSGVDMDLIENSSEFDFFPDTGQDESSYPESFETDYCMAADEISSSVESQAEPALNFTEPLTDVPEQEVELPPPDSPPESPLIASLADEEPASVPMVRHPGHDPLSILLAGRQAAAEGTVRQVEEELGQSSDEVEEYLCFKVADEEYALSIMSIKEIIKPREVTEVPRMPRFVSGVISLRGVIIPIMDMRLRLSLPVKEVTGRERILVLKTSNGLCGVLVDAVIQVVRIGSSAIEGPPAILDGVDREFVMGLGRYDNRMLILLNLESILDLNVH